MKRMVLTLLLRSGCLLLLLILPLTGLAVAGIDPAPYLQFPPLTRYVEPADFSWTCFVGLAAVIAAVLAPFIFRILTRRTSPTSPTPPHTTPWWGWAGLFLGIIAWIVAWTRIPLLEPLQPFTFTPLWIAYILLINALTWRRTGRCMMLNRPRYFLLLFPVSAVFWWFFEYLNRFVQNWHYIGIGDFSRLEYIIYATLPFSTVLPAVLGTSEWLGSFPRLHESTSDVFRVRVRHPRVAAVIVFAVSVAGLVALPLYPNLLFPLLWLSPLFLLTSVDAMRGRANVFTPIRHGNWGRIVRLGLAALCCGVFWEMWNWHSMAKWVYAVPYLNRFHIFEMPVLGYAGYIPFGLECAVIGDMVAELMDKQNPKKNV